jgi:hypothetical protein
MIACKQGPFYQWPLKLLCPNTVMNHLNGVVSRNAWSPRVRCVGANPSANLVSESDASVAGTIREQ